MKIIVYTISDCQFSKQEKDYLQSKGLTFEEKNLETNREFLTEMLALSNNFAGTPVTKIEKDDGQIVVLKGFTTEEFDKALGFQTTAPAVTQPQQAAVQPLEVIPTVPAVPVMPAAPQPQVVATPAAMPAEPVAAPLQQPQPVEIAATISTPAAPVMPVATVTAPITPVQPIDVAPTIPAAPTVDAVMQPPAMPEPVTAPIQQPVVPAQDQALNDILSSLQTKVEDTTATPQAPAPFPPANTPPSVN